MKLNYVAAQLIGVLALAASQTGCGSKESEIGAAITDCQLEAHRGIDERIQDEEKRKFALGEISNGCLKGKGFRAAESNPGCLVEPKSPDDGRRFVKASAECWSK